VVALALAAAVLATAALALPAPGTASVHGNPFAHARLFVDPNSDAAMQAQTWAHSRPNPAAQMRKIAAEPWAEWYGGWLPDPGVLFRQRVQDRYAPDNATAFIAVYNLPYRDCSGVYSAGGAHGAGAYKAWIRSIADAIGSYPTIVIVEPDGVPDTPCLHARGLDGQRLDLIAYATKTLASLSHTSVYIDAGRSDWLPAGEVISLLRRAGVRYARGFALDTTGYARTADELRYGHQIGAALGGKHFVVNTSRNGNGPLGAGQARNAQELWCNTPGRALGPRPTTHTGDRLADAYEWILHPGYSDGFCQGGPVAGSWWPHYALGLAQRARY
jgi:endoglucanase